MRASFKCKIFILGFGLNSLVFLGIYGMGCL